MVDPVFDELSVGDVSPGGRFDPLSLAESGDLEELKIKELKHCRLAMFVVGLHLPSLGHPRRSDRKLDRAHRGPGSRQCLDQRGQGLRLLLNTTRARSIV